MPPKLKPQRLHQIAETDAEQLVKKARTMTTESSMKDAFFLYADYLNNFIEPLRLGIESYRRSKVKGTIFRYGNFDSSSAESGLSKDNKEEVLEKAGKDLEAVREQHFSRLMKELQGTDFWKLRRAYSPGVCQRIITNHSSFKSTVNDGKFINLISLFPFNLEFFIIIIAGRSWKIIVATPMVAGAAVAAAAIAGRYGIHSWQAFKARPIVPRMRKFDEGGFQAAMTQA
ncbi:hypothetical protein YC2023_066885 [Brassica napus]